MKHTRVERATRFIERLFPEFGGYFTKKYLDWEDFCSLEEKMAVYNKTHSRNILVKSGSARVALITSDYVVKYDRDRENKSSVGDCEDELRAYNFVKKKGYDYLFAEIEKIVVNGYSFYVMPRVEVKYSDQIYHEVAALSPPEQDFIDRYFEDLHDENYGYNQSGRPIIIDYAWNYVPRK